MVDSSRTRLYIFICLLLVAVTLAVYWQTLNYGFTNYDDNAYVIENSNIRSGLTLHSIKWALTSGHESTWQPVVWLSYMLDTQIFGLKPYGFHLTNVLFHLLNTVLLFFLLHRMTKSIWRSAFVAAVFAVHPLHVESVAWVAERKDVLSAFFWMLAMLAYVRYVEAPTWPRYLLIALALALGLMSKPLLVTLPFALLLLDYWPLGRFRKEQEGRIQFAAVRRLVWEKVPLFAMAAASSVVTYIVQDKGGAVSSLGQLSLGARMSNALVSYVKYIGKTIWPTDLAVIYPHPTTTLPLWHIIASLLLLGLLTLLAFRAASKRPYFIVGWLWFLGTMLPMIGLIQFGMHGLADRFMYIPLIGLSIAMVWGVADLLRTRRIAVWALAVVSLLLLTVFAHTQAGYWRDSETLFRHALDCTSGNYVAHNQLASALEAIGDDRGAIDHYRSALSINPTFTDAHANLGSLYLLQGMTDQAVAHYSIMVKLQPADARGRYNMGLALQALGRLDEAAGEYLEAIRLKPTHTQAIGSLGNVLLMQGKIDEAIRQYLEVLNIDPTDETARRNLAAAQTQKESGGGSIAVRPQNESVAKSAGTAEEHHKSGMALLNEGKPEEAIVQFEKALSVNPQLADAHCNMGVALASLGNVDEAIQQYSQALKINPESVEAHSNLGSALGMKGQLDEAIKHFAEAARIKPNLTDVRANLAIAHFQQGNYAKAWKEVYLCRKYGGEPHPAFIQDLSARMPDPGQ